MTQRRIRLLVIAAVLMLILVLLAGYYYYYRTTKQLSFNLTANTAGSIAPPQFLFAFSGAGAFRLQRPIGVAIANHRVYVTDATRHTVFVYDENGKQLAMFGMAQTVTPLYIAVNPKNGNVYVSDRTKYSVLMFTPEGKYLGVFNPHLPKNQLPAFYTGKIQWAPIAVAFGSDGSMFVTDVLKAHRLLSFSPSGKFQWSVGTTAQVADPTKASGVFMFPNGVLALGSEVYVSDSNNQRVQVFSRQGKFKRFIITQGLPRGITSLLPFPSDPATSPPVRVAVVDTLAHFVTIWDGSTGERILNFGEQGTLDGQFSYPDGIARGDKNRLFVADTSNGRIQVWGWPEQVAALPVIGAPTNLLWCLVPFLLLPLLLLTRKRRFFATADFVERMIVMEKAELLPHRRRSWTTLEAEYELIKQMHYRDINFGELFESVEYSDSDARALAEKYELDENASRILAAAQRASVFATEDTDYRRMAKTIEIDVVDAVEFLKRFAKKDSTVTRESSGSDQ